MIPLFQKIFNRHPNTVFKSKPSWSTIFHSRKFEQDYRRHLNIQGNILEMGCGEGNLLFLTKQETQARLWGIDIDQKALENSCIKEGIKLIVGDVANTKLPSNSFDLIVSTMVIEHVDDKAMVKEIRRLLKPGGRLYISSVLKRGMAWYYLRNEKGKIVLARDHLREYETAEQFTRLFRGFNLESLWITPLKFPIVSPILRRLAPLLGQEKTNQLGSHLSPLEKIRIRVPGYYVIEAVFTLS